MNLSFRDELRTQMAHALMLKLASHDQIVFGARHSIINAIIDRNEELARHALRDDAELIKVHAAVVKIEHRLGQLLDLAPIVLLVFYRVTLGPLDRVGGELLPHFIIYRWNVPQDGLDLSLAYLLVAVYVIALERNEHLLLEGAHEHPEHKLDKLLPVNPLVPVRVDLPDDAIAEDFR